MFSILNHFLTPNQKLFSYNFYQNFKVLPLTFKGIAIWHIFLCMVCGKGPN